MFAVINNRFCSVLVNDKIFIIVDSNLELCTHIRQIQITFLNVDRSMLDNYWYTINLNGWNYGSEKCYLFSLLANTVCYDV